MHNSRDCYPTSCCCTNLTYEKTLEVFMNNTLKQTKKNCISALAFLVKSLYNNGIKEG